MKLTIGESIHGELAKANSINAIPSTVADKKIIVLLPNLSAQYPPIKLAPTEKTCETTSNILHNVLRTEQLINSIEPV